MAFFKLRSQGNEARPAAVSAPAESVEAMRRRARHRLIGAALLVLIGVVGFPLLFDTQPRPVAVDIPIEIPDRNKVKPLAMPSAAAPATAAPRASAAASASGMITESADGSEVRPDNKPAVVAAAPPAEPRPEAKPEPKPEHKPEPKPEPKPESRPVAKPEPKAETKPERKPEARVAEAKPEAKPELKPAKPAEPKPTAKPAAAEDAARARALLEGKASDGAVAAKPAAVAGDDAGRFVVQVGAYADADKAKEARQKLERAGLKTFTNVAKTSEGERTRVRVGPFASRAEADKAAARIKGLALPASVLTL